MLKKLFANCLLVNDFEIFLAFYRDILGLEVNSTESKFADFKLEGTSLAIFEKEAATAMFPKKFMGNGGGVIRGLVGFIKHQFSYKKVGFNLPYFVGMMFISGIVGLLTAVAIKELGLTFFGLDYLTPALAFIIGYAGGDFLENVYKIIIKKPSIYKLPDFWKKK